MDSSVYIIDDNTDVLKALQRLFELYGIPCRSFHSARDFLENCPENARGCLLVDMRMPGISGVELQQRLVSHDIHMPLIFMSGHHNITATVQAMKFGALEVLQKPFDHDYLLELIRKAMSLDQLQWRTLQQQRQFSVSLKSLSEREKQVMNQMINGASNKEIARELDLSPRTVETHRANIYHKLKVKNLTEIMKHVSSLQQEPYD